MIAAHGFRDAFLHSLRYVPVMVKTKRDRVLLHKWLEHAFASALLQIRRGTSRTVSSALIPVCCHGASALIIIRASPEDLGPYRHPGAQSVYLLAASALGISAGVSESVEQRHPFRATWKSLV